MNDVPMLESKKLDVTVDGKAFRFAAPALPGSRLGSRIGPEADSDEETVTKRQ